MDFISKDNERSPDVPSEEDCLLFSFVLDSNIIGLLCLLGFIGNIISFIVLWQEKTDHSIMFILEALVMADLTVTWTIFLQDVIPGLAYVVPVLRECVSACNNISQITEPLLYIAQGSVLWLSFIAALNQYVNTCYPSKSNMICSWDSARKQVISIILVLVFTALPLTFDTALLLEDSVGNKTLKLTDSIMYQYVYINGIIFALFLLIPIIAMIVICIKYKQKLNTFVKKPNKYYSINKRRCDNMFQVIITLCITLSICYIPSCIKCILQWTVTDFREDCGYLNFYLDSFCKLFQTLNSTMKIIIFYLFSQHFCDTFKQIVCFQKQNMDECSDQKDLKNSDLSNTALINSNLA